MGYVNIWMGDCLNSTLAMEGFSVGISFCRQTFINSSALLVYLINIFMRKYEVTISLGGGGGGGLAIF